MELLLLFVFVGNVLLFIVTVMDLNLKNVSECRIFRYMYIYIREKVSEKLTNNWRNVSVMLGKLLFNPSSQKASGLMFKYVLCYVCEKSFVYCGFAKPFRWVLTFWRNVTCSPLFKPLGIQNVCFLLVGLKHHCLV